MIETTILCKKSLEFSQHLIICPITKSEWGERVSVAKNKFIELRLTRKYSSSPANRYSQGSKVRLAYAQVLIDYSPPVSYNRISNLRAGVISLNLTGSVNQREQNSCMSYLSDLSYVL